MEDGGVSLTRAGLEGAERGRQGVVPRSSLWRSREGGDRGRGRCERERGRRRWERPNEEGIGQEMEIGPLLAALVGRRGKGVGSERLGLGLGEVDLEAGLGAGEPGGPAWKFA